MNNPLFVRNTITIQASPAAVWDALTNPEQTKKYMFGCETVSDWKEGSPLLWRGQYDGKEMIFVKGHIVQIVPEIRLVYTTFDPHGVYADIPENYLTVTYTLEEHHSETILTVTQGDFALVEGGEKRYQDAFNSGEGWNPIMVEIKKLLEK